MVPRPSPRPNPRPGTGAPPDLSALALHGLVTRSDALAAGVPAGRWRWLHQRGRLEQVRPGVSRLTPADATASREQAILAAVLSTGSRAMASHRTAAYLWGPAEADDDGPIDVTVPRASRPRPRPGVVVHRVLDRPDSTPSHRRGIPVTSPLRTLVDLGAVAPDRVEPFLVELTCSGLVTIPVVAAAVERHSRRGQIGVGALRAAVANWPLGDSRPDSVLEVDLARLLRRARLDGFEHHAIVEGFEVDFVHRARRLVLETDGFEFHSSRSAFETDRHRDAELVAAGWRVIRLTWARVTGHPDWVEAVVRRALFTG